MNKIWLSFVAVTSFAWSARGQRVEVQKQDRAQILHVQTALNHVTVLEMSEPVSTVAVGSPVFKVEWRENKVFIQPLEAKVATNLFVWTASGRFNYELDPAGSIPQMDFAIDQAVPGPPILPVSVTQPATTTHASPAEVLMDAKPIRLHGSIPEKHRVEVYLTDLLERDGQVFIRYMIQNQSSKSYVPGTPEVVALNAPRYRESLYSLSRFQLSPDACARLKFRGETRIAVTKGEIRSSRIEPGQETSGIVAIRLLPVNAGPIVLRLKFLGSFDGPINATLVL